MDVAAPRARPGPPWGPWGAWPWGTGSTRRRQQAAPPLPGSSSQSGSAGKIESSSTQITEKPVPAALAQQAARRAAPARPTADLAQQAGRQACESLGLIVLYNLALVEPTCATGLSTRSQLPALRLITPSSHCGGRGRGWRRRQAHCAHTTWRPQAGR